MSNAPTNNRDDDATESLDTQAVLDDYMKTYGSGKVCHHILLTSQLSQCQQPANRCTFWCFLDRQHPPAVNNLEQILVKVSRSATFNHDQIETTEG